MPYADKEKNRQYQREWSRKRYQSDEQRERRRVAKREWNKANPDKTRSYRENLVESIASKRRQAKAKSARRKAMAIWVRQYKSDHPCPCGESDPVALDFHHTDPSKKRFVISGMRGLGWDALKTEIEKCVVLCANCHRKMHKQQRLGEIA